MLFDDPATIDLSLDCRAITGENPTGARGAGGTAAEGRKGAPSRRVAPGEAAVLCDLRGPGRVTHLWLTVLPAPPEQLRALVIEGYYDDAEDPSISVPLVDLFGVAHGRPVPYSSMLASIAEGRGFNLYVPLPFGDRLRLVLTNHGQAATELYHQVDYVLGPVSDARLHVSWRRENPTVLGRDLVVVDGLHGPGRFLGCNVGVRVLDGGIWYGEGELKVFRDGDEAHPTICGTGLEDYVGTAWGMGAHHGPWAGAPLDVRPPQGQIQPDLVGFYRWHVPDPIVFRTDLRVTLQQIGAAWFPEGQQDAFEQFAADHPVAGEGWWTWPGVAAQGIFERVDDCCATAFVYCTEAQPVPRVDPASAVADMARQPYEQPTLMELLLSPVERRLLRPR